jgi:hypothetical protein
MPELQNKKAGRLINTAPVIKLLRLAFIVFVAKVSYSYKAYVKQG